MIRSYRYEGGDIIPIWCELVLPIIRRRRFCLEPYILIWPEHQRPLGRANFAAYQIGEAVALAVDPQPVGVQLLWLLREVGEDQQALAAVVAGVAEQPLAAGLDELGRAVPERRLLLA